MSRKKKIKTAIHTVPQGSNEIGQSAIDKDESENVRGARLLAKWSEQTFNFKLWLKKLEEEESPSDDDKHQNRLWAIEQSLDAASRLFKEHNIPLPQAWRALRLDLYEACRGRQTIYFKSAGKSNISMPKMVLKARTVAAVELLRQAGEKDLNVCYQNIAKLLKKNGLDLKEITKRKPSYLVMGDWRKEIFREKESFVRFMCEGDIRACGGKDESVAVLEENACSLIENAAKHFPDLLK